MVIWFTCIKVHTKLNKSKEAFDNSMGKLLCDDIWCLGVIGQTTYTVAIVSSPAGTLVSGSTNTFNYRMAQMFDGAKFWRMD